MNARKPPLSGALLGFHTGVSSLPGNPPLRLFCGCGSSPGARTLHATRSVRMPIISVSGFEGITKLTLFSQDKKFIYSIIYFQIG